MSIVKGLDYLFIHHYFVDLPSAIRPTGFFIRKRCRHRPASCHPTGLLLSFLSLFSSLLSISLFLASLSLFFFLFFGSSRFFSSLKTVSLSPPRKRESIYIQRKRKTGEKDEQARGQDSLYRIELLTDGRSHPAASVKRKVTSASFGRDIELVTKSVTN